MKKDLSGFIDFFKKVPDHRVNRKKLHSVEEILLIALCGTVAGCDSWEDFELYGKTKINELQNYLPFVNGTPSDDTFRRFFRALNPVKFHDCFISWVRSFQMNIKDKVIAIDGKTSRRSFDKATKAMHIVSAFMSEEGITLGQQKTDQKSNEITAIPELLETLDLEGAIVTIDAMGCQKSIINKIQEKSADFLINLKGNQKQLYEDVCCAFENKMKDVVYKQYSDVDKGHGRIEYRECTVFDNIQWLKDLHPQWCLIKTIVEVKSTREIKEKKTTEKRYYISSLSADPEKILKATRAHWGIENKLHWVLDICFGDDHSRIRKGNAPENVAIIKKTALNLLQIVKKSLPNKRISIKRMRKLSGWDPVFMDTVLKAKF